MQHPPRAHDPDPVSGFSVLAPAIEYWLELVARAGGPPSLPEIDLSLLSDLVPEARLIEARHDRGCSSGRFRYREIGGTSLEVLGRDVTEEGARLGWADCEAALRAMVTGAPVGINRALGINSGVAEALALPLAVRPSSGQAMSLLIMIAPVAA